jgi:hypothetical protein
MNKLLTAVALCVLASAAQAQDIKAATKKCEVEAPAECVAVTCPKFCAAIFKGRKNVEAQIEKCKAECTPQKRCVLKPLGGGDSPGNAELEAQTREHAIACIAETRDPDGKKSGRRMTPWRELLAPSYAKLVGEKSGTLKD